MSVATVQTTGASLESLPHELLLDILKRLLTTRDPADPSRNKMYHDLCFIKPLNAAATEILYANGASYNVDYRLFLRTVLRYPHLAKLVQTVRLGVASPPGWSGKTSLSKPSKDDVQLYLEALDHVRKADVSETAKLNWSNTGILVRKAKDWKTFAELILSHCRNIKSATLGAGRWTQPLLRAMAGGEDDRAPQYWWGETFPQPCNTIAAMPTIYDKLQSVDIRCATVPMSYVATLFGIKTLQVLSLSSISDQSSLEAVSRFKEDVSNVHSLHLEGEGFTLKTVALLAGCCKSLQTFSIKDLSFVYRGQFDPAAANLHTALQKHRNNLRRLELFSLTTGVLRLGEWSEFTAVDTFYTDALSIFRTLNLYGNPDFDWPRLCNVIPQNIERLGIYDCRDFQKEFLGDEQSAGLLTPFLDEGNLPYLRSLHIECDQSHLPHMLNWVMPESPWVERFRKRNVEFHTVSPPGRSLVEVHNERYLIPLEECNADAWSPPNVGPTPPRY